MEREYESPTCPECGNTETIRWSTTHDPTTGNEIVTFKCINEHTWTVNKPMKKSDESSGIVLCKDCEFYLTPEQVKKIEETEKYCTSNCTSGKLNDTQWNKSDVDSDSVSFWDYEAFAAYIRVQPDFGCVHGKKRDEHV